MCAFFLGMAGSLMRRHGERPIKSPSTTALKMADRALCCRWTVWGFCVLHHSLTKPCTSLGVIEPRGCLPNFGFRWTRTMVSSRASELGRLLGSDANHSVANVPNGVSAPRGSTHRPRARSESSFVSYVSASFLVRKVCWYMRPFGSRSFTSYRTPPATFRLWMLTCPPFPFSRLPFSVSRPADWGGVQSTRQRRRGPTRDLWRGCRWERGSRRVHA